MSKQIVERVNTYIGTPILKGVLLKKGLVEKTAHMHENYPYIAPIPSIQEENQAQRMEKQAGLSELSCPKLENALRNLARGVVTRSRR